MHLSAFAFLMIGVLFEIGTVCLAGRIKNLYDEDEQIEMKAVENDTNSNQDISEVMNKENSAGPSKK